MAEPVDRQNGNVRHSRHRRKLRIEANIPGLTCDYAKKIVRGRGLFRALALRSVSVHGAYQGRSVLPDPEGQKSSLYELQSVRDGRAEDIGVKQHDDSHDSPEGHRMPCDEAENNSLVAHLLGGGSGNRDGLGIDHFAHDSPSTVCRAHENGVDSELLRCNSLQAPKQRV